MGPHWVFGWGGECGALPPKPHPIAAFGQKGGGDHQCNGIQLSCALVQYTGIPDVMLC